MLIVLSACSMHSFIRSDFAVERIPRRNRRITKRGPSNYCVSIIAGQNAGKSAGCPWVADIRNRSCEHFSNSNRPDDRQRGN